MDSTSPADRLLLASCEDRPDDAARLLDENPSLSSHHFLVACVTGEAEAVRAALAADPTRVSRLEGPLPLPAILHTCLSTFLRTHPNRVAGIVEVARLLLEHGADPNATWACGTPPHAWNLSALFAAAGRSNNADLTRLLLEAGANPNDGESLYHSAEFEETTCTRLLLKHGAVVQGTNAVHRKLDYDDLPGFRLFLDHGVSPNLVNHCGDSLVHAVITNDRRLPFLELLADRGADLRMPDSHGLTPYRKAARLGRPDLASFLQSRGAAETLSTVDRFLAACTRGDIQAAKDELVTHPDLRDSLNAWDRALLPALAWRGRIEGVRALMALGIAPSAPGPNDVTALHNAAWMGHHTLVDELISAGAPLEIVENQYQATPLKWALHGRQFSRDRSGRTLARGADHDAVIRRLLAAGARVSQEMMANLPPEFPEDLRKLMVAAAGRG